MQWENWSVYWDQKFKRHVWCIDARQPNVSSGWVQYEVNITPNSRKPNFFPLHSVTWIMSRQRRLISSFMPTTWMERMFWSSTGHRYFKLALWESRGIFPMIVSNSFQGPKLCNSPFYYPHKSKISPSSLPPNMALQRFYGEGPL